MGKLGLAGPVRAAGRRLGGRGLGPAGAPGLAAAGDDAGTPKLPRRWSWYLPSASSVLVSSSSSRYCSADLFTPTATMVSPLRFLAWQSGAMQ